MSLLSILDAGAREALSGLVARVVMLDADAVVRLRSVTAVGGSVGGSVDGTGMGDGVGARVTAWATTPFEVLTSFEVPGELCPADLTVAGHDLLAALAVTRGDRMDPGRAVDDRWRAELPPAAARWERADTVPVAELAAVAEQGIAAANEQGRPSDELLDAPALTVASPGTRGLTVPMRCLLALSGLGLLERDPVEVSATDAWLRLGTPGGAVLRRRRPLLPLVFP